MTLMKGAHIVTKLATFTLQATAKDTVGNTTYQNLSATSKAQFLLSDIVARATGHNIYPALTGVKTQTFNPAGIVNKYTGIGVGAWIIAALAPKGTPYKGMIKSFGKDFLLGGILGGLIDDSVRSGGGQGSTQESFRHVSTPKGGGNYGRFGGDYGA
jgi:hypothetical protein